MSAINKLLEHRFPFRIVLCHRLTRVLRDLKISEDKWEIFCNRLLPKGEMGDCFLSEFAQFPRNKEGDEKAEAFVRRHAEELGLIKPLEAPTPWLRVLVALANRGPSVASKTFFS